MPKSCPLDNPKLSTHEIEDLAAARPTFVGPEGISGRIKVDSHEAVYPYRHTRRRVSFEPTTAGRRHPAYQRTRLELGDDWSVDLSGSSPETWGDYMRRALRCRRR